ncbi:MAG: MBL fold metallo-hydrolase, partial [Erysipelotrichaceae bacterium]
MEAVQLRENLHWVGVQDPNLRVFDIIMVSPYGTSYNSYVIKGNGKTALVETAKEKFFDAYLEKLKEVVDPMEIDYLIVDHTEPDHAGSIARLLEVNPYIVVVGSAVAISFLKEIINRDFAYVTVKHNDTLALGDKTLRFFSVPNLHWPDTIYTYVEEDKYLFTCDSFGAHFAAPLLYSQVENHEQYDDAFKYYFDCIMGPYKSFVLKALDMIDPLEVDLVCTGHGPIVDTNFDELKRRYREWSTPKRTHKLPYVVIPYVSAYGYTEQMKDEIIRGLNDVAEMDIAAFDLVEVDAAHVMNEIAQADAVLFGTPTIVAEALKPIWDLTSSMHSVTHRHLYASAFGSYGWSGEGVMHIMDRLHQLHMKTFDGLRIKFRPGEKDLVGCYEWGYEFGCFMLNKQVEKVHKGGKTYVKCLVCGEILEEGLETCPVCGVGKENFVPYIVEEVTFKNDSTQHFVIVGNGNAGVNAAAAIRERNASASITLLSEEPYLGYNRPQLTKQMLGDLEESIPKIK